MLRNLRVGAVADRQDAVGRNISWPARLELQGFAYDRLGGYTGGGQRDMLLRDPGYYTELLARDPTFSRQPYQQLAGVFRAAGDADRADAVLYAARDREMMANWRAGDCRHGLGLLLLNGDCWSAAGLAVLKATIGYGLGGGYWLALAWVGFFTVAGVLVLRASPAARARGLGWRLGASLDRLLPIIELNKEFGDFFDDPKRRRLKGWQLAYFSAHAVAGYVLAAFVAAGLAGLTQAQ